MPGRESFTGRRDPTRCIVCRHPDIVEIDIALAQGKSIYGLSRDRGINRASLTRHKKKGHVMATAEGEPMDLSRPRDQHMATSYKLYELLGRVQRKLEADKDIDVGTVRVFINILREQRATLDAASKAMTTDAPRQTTAQIVAEVMGVIADATVEHIDVREDIATMFVARGLIEPAVNNL